MLRPTVGDGRKWYRDSGAPASTLGDNGDGYTNTDTNVTYLKTDGTWTLTGDDLDLVAANLLTAVENETEAQTDHVLVAAPSAGYRLVITKVGISNGATAGTVKFEEDTASAKTQKGLLHYMSANSVASYTVNFRLTEAKNFGFTSVTATTHSVYCEYYVEEV